MSNEPHDSGLLPTLLWSLAGLVLLYVGLFVVLMVDAIVFDSALWMALPGALHDPLQLLYSPILWLIGEL